jgi:hypothetical protein
MVIDTFVVPTVALWQPAFMLNTKGVTAALVTLAEEGSVTAATRPVPAAMVGVTVPVAAPVMS